MNVSKRKAERIGQKERTRQKLFSAARSLVEEGETLTIARGAERANLAEATAYCYYRNPRSLLRDALSASSAELAGLLAWVMSLQWSPWSSGAVSAPLSLPAKFRFPATETAVSDPPAYAAARVRLRPGERRARYAGP